MTMGIGILLIDDDVSFCGLLKEYLELHAMKTDCVHTGKDGLAALQKVESSYDMVLLDIFLPDINGIDLLRSIRQFSDIPVVVLSAHNEEADRIVALEMGADDYVPKISSSRELLAHIRAVIRRKDKRIIKDGNFIMDSDSETIKMHGLEINKNTFDVTVDGNAVVLTNAEFQLLYFLIQQPGHIFTRDTLMGMCADHSYDKSDRSIDVRISSLRQKLGDSSHKSRFIRTWRGLGYSFIK